MALEEDWNEFIHRLGQTLAGFRLMDMAPLMKIGMSFRKPETYLGLTSALARWMYHDMDTIDEDWNEFRHRLGLTLAFSQP